MMQPRQFAPGGFVFAVLSSIAVAPFVEALALLPAGIFAVYSLANVTASVALALKRGIQYLPLFPLVFVLLHFGYGLGFLWGLIKFSRRWKEQ
jgi:hypothetical protein